MDFPVESRGRMEEYFVPDGSELGIARERVSHMGIGAHQDDLEIFAYHGIAACYRSEDLWFAGVTVSDGSGSARSGPFAGYSDEEMVRLRHREQNRAAAIGRYSFQAQLGYPSAEIKSPEGRSAVIDELRQILEASAPRVLYLHNPADKHDTHVALLACCIEALRAVPSEARPAELYGCEVWRDLDWLPDARKVALPVDAYPELARELLAAFESQVRGGKDYVSATLGRRRANATYFQSHHVDGCSALSFAMDLKPLMDDPQLTLGEFAERSLSDFSEDVLARIDRNVK